MDKLQTYSPLAGRFFLTLIFLMSGATKITGWSGTAGYMAAKGMPMVPFFLTMAIILELGGGLAILLGYKARLGALALIVFTIPATLLFHNPWAVPADQMQIQMIMFMKNLAIIGGLLLIIGFGAGPISIDDKRGA